MNKPSQTSKMLLNNGIARSALLVSNILIAFFLMPFMVHNLGPKAYGYWSLLGSIIGYLAFLDLGLSSAVSRFASKSLGEKKYEEINFIANTSFWIFMLLGTISLVLAIIIGVGGYYYIKDKIDAFQFMLSMIILGLVPFMDFPMRSINGIMQSILRDDICAISRFVNLAIRTILIFILLKKYCDIVTLSIIMVIASFVAYSLQFWLFKKQFTYIKINLKYFQKTKFISFFKYALSSLVAQLSTLFRFRISTVIISAFLNVASVTFYTIPTQLIEYFMQLVSGTLSSLTPLFSRYEGENDFDSIKNKLILTTKISSILSFSIFSIMILVGKQFIYLWMGDDFTFTYIYVVILGFAVTLSLSQNPSVSLMYGISKHKYFAVQSLIEGVANVIMSIVFIKLYGLIGVVIGTAIPMLITKIIFQPAYISKTINIRLIDYCFPIVKVMVFSIVLIIPFYYLANRYFFLGNYWRIILFSICFLFFFLPIQFFFIFDINERKQYFYSYMNIILAK